MTFRPAIIPFPILACCCLCFCHLSAEAQVPAKEGNPSLQSLTLSEALTRVFALSPELVVSELEIQSAAARIIQAGLKPNPELAVDTENFPAMTSAGVSHYLEGTFQITQRLELGGKRAMRVQAAEKEKQVAGRDLQVKKNKLMAETSLAFADVLVNQERLSNQRELTGLARRSYATVVDRVAAGKVSPVEQTRATVALSSAELEEETQQRELTAAKDRLAMLWGGSSAEFDAADGRFEIPSPPSGPEICVESNPDLLLASAAIDSRRAALALEQAEKKPDLTFSAGFRRLNLEDKNAWVAGVSIPIPIFDKRQGAIAEARIGVDRSLAEKKAVEWRLRSVLSQARHEHEIALLEASSLAKTALPAAKEALAAVEEGYRLGKFDYLNVLDSQRTYAELQRRYIEAVAAGLKATIEVQRLAGCDPQANVPRVEANPKETSHEK
jgi:cobalt-zinc-cadmium efflux system outer membrane protein